MCNCNCNLVILCEIKKLSFDYLILKNLFKMKYSKIKLFFSFFQSQIQF